MGLMYLPERKDGFMDTLMNVTPISDNVVSFSDLANNSIISFQKVEQGRIRRRLDATMIQQETMENSTVAKDEHSAEPIKDIMDITNVSEYLIRNGRYRDNMLFIVGINFGLRVSDLLRLRFNMILDSQLNFKTTFPILEKKTSNTRRTKKNRYITINDAAVDAIVLYLRHMSQTGRTVRMNDYLFKSESNNGRNEDKPMSRMTVDRILKDVARKVGLTCRVSSHTLRKTFGYHQMVMSGNDPRKLLLLQKIFGHSTASQTLDYIGITGEEIEEAYLNLNLGSTEYYGRMSSVIERGA